jgi:hypothetical protein
MPKPAPSARRRLGGVLAWWSVVVASVLASLSTSTVAAATVKPGQDHACIVGAPPAHGVDWSKLRNPVLSFPTVGAKDQALQWSGGSWHMLYSDMVKTDSPPHVRFSVAISSSPDLRHWTTPRIIAENAASPDIVRGPTGQFIVTYQTPAGLAYRTSSSASLTSWSRAHPLGPGLAGRMIDAALAFTGHGVILGFKAGTTSQHFEIAWAPRLSGRFRLIGRPDISVYNDTVENYEFVTVHGRWDLVATSNTLDQPFLFRLSPGNPSTPATWLDWGVGRELTVPSQPLNTGSGLSSVGFEHANSAFLCVGPQGEYYLTYAASTELTRFGGWGHARIGLARSSNLVDWEAAPN